jgi:signal transduction histidine kinase
VNPNTGLRHRILRWLFLYAVLVSAAVMVGGYIVHERVEHLAWESLLRSELDYYGQRVEENPRYLWKDTETLRMFGLPGLPALPSELASLRPGLHDDRMVAGVNSVVLRDQVDGIPMALALDLSGFEGAEGAITLAVAGGTIGLILVLGLLVMWGLGRAIEPLVDLARQVRRLQPTRDDQQVTVADDASAELLVIARAFNDYIERTRTFVEREHAFISSASHELRTPVAVIAGAAELVLGHDGMPHAARTQVARIHRTARNVEDLITLLLMLARDPARLASISDQVALDQLLPEIIEDHRHLTRDKQLVLTLQPLTACDIIAPMSIVQAAIGNLLRNAIEHSDRGEIRIRLEADATVVIEDPGHGMSPEEISAIYAHAARGGGDSGGIGLELIARLCEHLGWDLHFASGASSGTTTTLHFGPARTQR